jgi:hypothetical protein
MGMAQHLPLSEQAQFIAQFIGRFNRIYFTFTDHFGSLGEFKIFLGESSVDRQTHQSLITGEFSIRRGISSVTIKLLNFCCFIIQFPC